MLHIFKDLNISYYCYIKCKNAVFCLCRTDLYAILSSNTFSHVL